MENVLSIISHRYAYDISHADMEYIVQRDKEQWTSNRDKLDTLLTDWLDRVHYVEYDLECDSIILTVAPYTNTKDLQEILDHVTMYVEGLDCHWITGAME